MSSITTNINNLADSLKEVAIYKLTKNDIIEFINNEFQLKTNWKEILQKKLKLNKYFILDFWNDTVIGFEYLVKSFLLSKEKFEIISKKDITNIRLNYPKYNILTNKSNLQEILNNKEINYLEEINLGALYNNLNILKNIINFTQTEKDYLDFFVKIRRNQISHFYNKIQIENYIFNESNNKINELEILVSILNKLNSQTQL